MATTPTEGNDTISVGLGENSVNALGGTDRLILNWTAVTAPIVYWWDGWNHLSDEAFNTIDYVNFESYDITGGAESDDLRGGNLETGDRLVGGGGNDTISGGLGGDIIDGGAGTGDRWSVDYSSLGTDIAVILKAAGTSYTVLASGAQVKNIEALTITTGVGADTITTTAVTGNDNITTSGGDDTISPGLGFDTVSAGDGIDTLVLNYSTKSADILHTDLGGWWFRYQDGQSPSTSIDFYRYAIEHYNITGGSGNDNLSGSWTYDGNDRLVGGAGNDTLYGYGGTDTINGGDGTDTWRFVYDEVNTHVLINIAATTQTAGTTADPISGLATLSGIEQLIGDTYNGNDVITCNPGFFSDTLNTNEGDDTITTGRGVDSIHGGGGSDTMIVDWSAVTTNINHVYDSGWYLYTSASGDWLRHYGIDTLNVTGGSGDDYLSSFGGDDTLTGGAGNDTLNSSSGLATIDGGLGTDIWQANVSGISSALQVNCTDSQTTAQGTLSGHSIRNIEGFNLASGAGNDVLNSAGFTTNDTLETNDGNDSANLGRGVDNYNAGGGSDTLILNWSMITTNINHVYDSGWYLYTSGSGDSLRHYSVETLNVTGGSGNDYLSGFGGNDTLIGGGGNDTLNSSSGLATIDGGAGTDIWQADVSGILDPLLVNCLTSQTAAQGTVAGHNIRKIEAFNLSSGGGNDNLNSSNYANNDVVNTNDGNDTVFLGKGFDTVNGGNGTDTLIFDYSTMTTGVSRVYDGGWYVYGDKLNTASVRYYSFEKFNLTGGAGDDNLLGGNDNDTLVGGAGDDILTGYAGKDSINGGAGDDRWDGNYDGATASYTLTLNASGNGTLKANGVTNWTVLTSIENLTLVTGNAPDIINALARPGDHSITTQEGNDTVKVGAGQHNVNLSGGNDLLEVNFSTSTSAIRHIYDSGWYKFYDTEGLNSVRYYSAEQLKVTGGSGHDRLSGFGKDDIFSGGDGNDVLTGNEGNDILTGGAGNDIFAFSTSIDNGTDTITDAASGDTIRITGTNLVGPVTLGNGVTVANNRVELAYDSGLDETTLYIGTNGTPGADIAITLQGEYAVGGFTLSGRNINLTAGAINPGTAGNDTINGTTGNDELSGGAGNDKLYGKAGNDILDGGADNDMLTGGMGADDLTGGTGIDTFVFTSIWESTPGTLYHDVIEDFSHAEGDKINLAAIDANPVVAGDQDFTFITGEFSGESGQLRYDATAGLVMADVNGDGMTDLEIGLIGVPALVAGDFVL